MIMFALTMLLTDSHIIDDDCYLDYIYIFILYYIFKPRIPMKKSMARQQENNEMKPTNYSTLNASRDRVISGEYLEIRELN